MSGVPVAAIDALEALRRARVAATRSAFAEISSEARAAHCAATFELRAGEQFLNRGVGLKSVGELSAVPFDLMAERSIQQSNDLDGEHVRRLRLRADGLRPLAVNLEETILLARKLFELRDAALRAR